MQQITKQRKNSFPSFLKIIKKKILLRMQKNFPNELDSDSRLVRNHFGLFYLRISDKLDEYSRPSQNKVIAFDPRNRIFCDWI